MRASPVAVTVTVIFLVLSGSLVAAGPPSVCDLARGLSYDCETHAITAGDGFVLEGSHLPAKRTTNSSRRPIILQHGLTDCAFTWLFNARPEQNLATLLVDRGYDVFLTNSRGNAYSLATTPGSFNSSDDYWKAVDMDRMAQFDVPAFIAFALNLTGAEALSAYVGHSQGGMQGFAAFSTLHPAVARKVKLFVGLAPAVYVNATTSSVFKKAGDDYVFTLLKDLGTRRVFFTDTVLADVGKLCEVLGPDCWKGLEDIFGHTNLSNFNVSLWPRMTQYDPAGTSVFNMIHWMQWVRHGLFQMHNYGDAENQQRYGRPTAPMYHLDRMTHPPTVIYHGTTDALVPPAGIARVIAEVPRGVIRHIELLQDYAHMDFVWGLDAADRVYRSLIKYVDNADRGLFNE